MQTIVLYRKQSAAEPVNLPAATVRADRETFAARCRVNRDALLDHFAPTARGRSSFHRQTALPPSVIDSPYRRTTEHADAGWIVPEDCYGRMPKSGVRDLASTCQSILLWIKQTAVVAGWCDASEISLVVEERD